MSTRISKLLTAVQLPLMDAYLDYLLMRHAIRLSFLPDDHILADQPTYICGKPKLNFPSKHRLDSIITRLTKRNFEDRYRHTDTLIPRIVSPHTDKHTNPTGIHERWIQSLPDFTMMLYTDGSKLEEDCTGSGWVIYCIGNGTARCITACRYHLGTRAEVFDAELHTAQEALSTLQHLDTPAATAYTPSDHDPGADHDKDPEPYSCGESFVSSTHILLECRLFQRPPARMLQKTPDVKMSGVLSPEQALAVMVFLKTTGLGYTAELHTDSGDGRGDGREGEREREREGEVVGGDEEGGERGRARVDDAMFREGEGVGGEEEDGGGADEWRFELFE
jgi:hypothetical protein